MTDSAGTGTPTTHSAEAFTERLYVPWWGWPLPLVAAGLLAAEVHMGYPGVRAWLPYVLLIPLTIALIVQFGRTRVAVADGELLVRNARLPLRFVAEVEVSGKDEKRKVLGPEPGPGGVRHAPHLGRPAGQSSPERRGRPHPLLAVQHALARAPGQVAARGAQEN